ncbi:MAG: thioredoxin family protein [Aequorivita antarctica]
MKNLILFSIAFTFSILTNYAQPFNTEIMQNGETPMLLGKINKEALSVNTYSEWFLTNYEAYQPNKEKVVAIQKLLPQYTITVFFGTWCGDSKKELPIFYKILEEAQFPLDRLTVIAVSNDSENYKQSPGGEEEGLNIHRVPTFIFYKDGKEINRIVEHPVNTFEDDILQIIQDKGYVPNYNAVTIVNDALTAMGFEKFQRKSKKLLPKLKKEAKHLGELSTYSSVLFYSERKAEGLYIAEMNTILFPNESYSYENLANKLYVTNQMEKALLNYEKSLAINPNNERVKSAIAAIKGKE